MDWLNYHHLLYFWTTARLGSLTAAARQLRLSPSTVSAQIRTLEETLGVALFVREGRGLALTPEGEIARAHADRIFGLGQSMLQALQGQRGGATPARLRVGVSDILHKWVAHRALAPALTTDPPIHLLTRSDRAERLLADLALHELDLVLTDAPVGLAADVPVASALLGASAVALAGNPSLVAPLREGFPGSLEGAPVLLPATGTSLRRDLEHWFDARGLRPRVVAEFEDSALMKAFGRDGAGLLPVPVSVAREVEDVYGFGVLGVLDEVTDRTYGVTRPHPPPALDRLLAHARSALAPPPAV